MNYKIFIIILICLLFNFKYYYFVSNKFICLCVIGKEENAYIKEFVNHYKTLGFDHIYLYDNNELNGEKFEDVIRNEIKEDFISIINYRGYKGVQLNAYFNSYKNNYKNYRWLAFFDIDEFLELPENKTIRQFLENKIFSNCQNIKIGWLEFTDNDLTKYENKSVQERFTTPLVNHSRIVKSVVRGNLNVNYWDKATNAHTSKYGFQSCNPSGKIIDPTSVFIDAPNNTTFLKHYITKTIEEYINKINKGSVEYAHYPGEWIKVKINNFFGTKKITKKKLDIIKKKLNYTFKP